MESASQLTCEGCGGTFQHARRTVRFCSQGCRRQVWLSSIGAVCNNCGAALANKDSQRCPSCEKARRKVERRKQGPVTKDMYRGVARAQYSLEGVVCETCKQTPALDRHHIDGNPANNESLNIAFLCRRCHMEVDGRLKATRERACRTVAKAAKASTEKKRRATHCKHGHPFTEENTGRDARGNRYCRECKRGYTQAWKAKNRG